MVRATGRSPSPPYDDGRVTYLPFTLKYRPQTFSDVVGQGTVAVTLRNALREGRVANAFLFTGSRGTGKTSMARILSKALNCPNAVDAEPCNRCEICAAVSAGEDLDVLEIDGASNRGIDEIRAIRDNAGYRPARSRFRIYVIDEVHMLTIQAFNALLKTLEEPPPHVKFIFATTEFQDVPETIVSRCQRFDFRRITADDIVARLRHICEREGVNAAPGVLEEIAKKAEGGLRDSVGLLDQIVSFAGNELVPEDVDRALGNLDADRMLGLVVAIGDGDPAGILGALDEAFEAGRDAEEILRQLLETYREALSATARGLEPGTGGRRAHVIDAARTRHPLDRLLYCTRLLLNTWREVKSLGQGRLQLEVALLKAGRSTDLVPWRDVLARLDRLETRRADAATGSAATARLAAAASKPSAPPSRPSFAAPTPKPAVPPLGRVVAPSLASPTSDAPKASPAPASTATASDAPRPAFATGSKPPGLEIQQSLWRAMLTSPPEAIVPHMKWLDGSLPVRVDGSTTVVGLPGGATLAINMLDSPKVKPVIESAWGGFAPPGIKLRFEASGPSVKPPPSGPRKDVYSDPAVRKVMDAVDGGIIHVEQDRP